LVVLYDDGRCLLDDDGLTLRRYYFPFATSKRIPYGQIREFHARPMGWLTGKGHGWGTSNPRYWLPLDMTRRRKSILIVVDVAAHVKPAFSPDKPDEVLRVLGEHVPQPPHRRDSRPEF
jgi:hypothetical protein